MRLKCLGSGSSGNCYILENEMEALVIEAGLPFKEVKRALGFNVRKIVGALIGHSHKDHSKYILEYEQAGIRVFKPYELEFKVTKKFGNFTIRCFDLIHDVPCYGFYIEHPEIGKMIYASDTEYIKYRFKNLDHIICECNYSKEFIDNDSPNYAHVLQGHMSLQTCKEFIKANKSSELRNIILCHISDNNGNPDIFLHEIKEVVTSDVNVYVVEKGMQCSLDLMPF